MNMFLSSHCKWQNIFQLPDSNIPATHHSAEGVTAGPSLGPGHRLLGEVRSLPAGGEVILDLVIGVVIW